MTSTVERAVRDQRILAAREQGEQVQVIATRERLSVRHVYRALERARRKPVPVVPVDLDGLDATRTLAEVVAIHQEVVAELGKLGRMRSPSAARVGALKARAAVAVQLLEVLAAAGVTPERPTDWSVLRDAKRLAEVMLAMVDRLGLDVDAVLAAWNGDSERPSKLPQLVVELQAAA